MDKAKTILIIEDHDGMRLILSNLLKKKAKVITKQDAVEALAWLGQGNIPELILLDMFLPKINGLDFLINLRSSGLFQHIPVLVISGNNSNFLNQYENLRIDGILKKPFKPDELFDRVNVLLQLPIA